MGAPIRADGDHRSRHRRIHARPRAERVIHDPGHVDPGYPGYDYRPGWVFTGAGGRTNRTGSSGGSAIVDSDNLGQHNVQDRYLTSPVTDLSDRANAAVEFDTDLVPAINSTATVELSPRGLEAPILRHADERPHPERSTL
jgi:hypothetical protein